VESSEVSLEELKSFVAVCTTTLIGKTREGCLDLAEGSNRRKETNNNEKRLASSMNSPFKIFEKIKSFFNQFKTHQTQLD
jgi:hypothetical protein